MRLVPGFILCLGILLVLSLSNSGVARHGLQTLEYYDAPGHVAVIPHDEPGVPLLGDAVLFERLTAQNIRCRLAIVMDDIVLAAPVIQDKINSGKLVVTGNFTITNAADSGPGFAPHAASQPLSFSVLESRVTAPATGKGVGS